jgi:hypothetical protein
MKAIDGIKGKPEYANLRISHGKDRCANPPRIPTNGGRRGGHGGGSAPPSAGPSGHSPMGGSGHEEGDFDIDEDDIPVDTSGELEDPQARARVDSLVET